MNGYYNPLMQMVQHAVDEGFSTDSAIRLINISDTPEQLISSMDTYTSPSEDQKWNTER